MKNSRWFCVFAGLGAIGVLVAAAVALASISPARSDRVEPGAVLQVVAGENFWGSIVSQIGGARVHVQSVVSDPNADPHEYETSTQTARAVAAANYVVLNGAGYDSWGGKLLAASPNPRRKTLTVAALLGKHNGDNPHFWYNPAYVNVVAGQVEGDLATLDPHDTSYFQSRLALLRRSLGGYQSQIAQIAQTYHGSEVAATEDIFAYLAAAAQLDLISPPAFTQAVAEGNDPPAASVAAFRQQLQSGQVKLLVYNLQTVTPLTDSVKKLAGEQGIPMVGISETIQPPTASFQSWMSSELAQMQSALQKGTGR